MAKDIQQHLSSLAESRHSSTLSDAEKALGAAGFELRKKKGNVRVWQREHLVVTLHRPHGKHMKAGAVDTVIRNIEAARHQEKGGNQ